MPRLRPAPEATPPKVIKAAPPVQPETPDEKLYTREQLAAELRSLGYPVTASMLTTRACRGGGPPYRKFSRHCLYRLTPAIAWAKAEAGEERETSNILAAG